MYLRDSKDLSFALYRTQFIIRLASTMAVNKPQGQTLDKTGLYTHQNKPIFGHDPT